MSFPKGSRRDDPLDVSSWLKSRKSLKFMGKQDLLALRAAGLAVQEAGLPEETLRQRTGIYLSVGYIPFERSNVESLARNSSQNGRFSMDLFSTAALGEVNPLLTFRCLPNMPIFHVSLNLGVQGPSFITYPGGGQFYVALEQAIGALQRDEVDAALVGAVCDQDNFLVERHFKRLKPTQDWVLADAAGFLVLEKRSTAARRSAPLKAEWVGSEIRYEPFDPFQEI
jgi:3-oxoacyl-(acyl-carrier-protein) synthase